MFHQIAANVFSGNALAKKTQPKPMDQKREENGDTGKPVTKPGSVGGMTVGSFVDLIRASEQQQKTPVFQQQAAKSAWSSLDLNS